MRLIKVTFTATSGEETTGFASLHANDVVELPKRMLLRVRAALEAGEGYAIVAHQGGYAIPLLLLEDARYKLDVRHATSDAWLTRLIDAFRKPSKDQMQAYGRYYHTLSAACAVGFVGYAAGIQAWTVATAINAACLLAGAAVLFAIGAVLAKGDK
ncbi:conserved protein of unknown function (plasmid) [Cupriavidus taiwanensis]|uniref:Transmembrane protein n=1 Tax=Cupriavidus taiwanensis TaxID=164546 RepID=A0A375HEK4_9BURK|nr:hypothetical protein [Cupriavidus taiwanensis]SOZ72658.1 conserved hypothetical protein [Cupriavidus taiwanensis]SOZ73317.1 conserved hypothetical protein [Cupriavidus taiwanensis]SOZ75185.1 conserved hypothetical protein [Cupriavidus taiwanensis]SPA03707.1 conserved protein of unknown function [Cupriavidus taiwanensis]SPA11610.1 conserved protein of unknown function [Cupriavidus taiwanensis]